MVFISVNWKRITKIVPTPYLGVGTIYFFKKSGIFSKKFSFIYNEEVKNMAPTKEKTVEFDFEFKAITEDDIKAVNGIVKSLIEYRDKLIFKFNLQNITNESPKDDVLRYNRFVNTWNEKLYGLVIEAELKPLSRKCEQILDQALARCDILEAQNAKLQAQNTEMQAQMQAQIDELKRMINSK
jgi:hypothetical protein